MINKMTILGVFYDGYEDLWKDFLKLIYKHWPDNPYKIIIANQSFKSKSTPYENIEFVNAGPDAEYSRKIQTALKLIDSDYVLLLLEDFFIEKKVLTGNIAKILEFVEKNRIVYYSMPIPSFVVSKEKKRYEKDRKLFRLSGKKEYVLNCQPAIWKKDFLSLCIGDQNYNAWVFEGIYSKKDFIRRQGILENCVVDYRNPLNIIHGAIQGKIIRKTKKDLKKNGYLLNTSRPCLSVKETIVYGIKKIATRLLYAFNLMGLKKRINKRSVLAKYGNDIDRISSTVLDEKKFLDYKKGLEVKNEVFCGHYFIQS